MICNLLRIKMTKSNTVYKLQSVKFVWGKHFRSPWKQNYIIVALYINCLLYVFSWVENFFSDKIWWFIILSIIKVKVTCKIMTIAGLCHQNKNLKKTAHIAVRFCWILNNKITNVLNCSSIHSSKSFHIGNYVFEWHVFSVKEILIDVDF